MMFIKRIKMLYQYYKNLKYLRYSFSQEGEDIVLERFFREKESGFYVDLGAHHPIRFSNTYKFYLRGWRGLNIDATPGSMKKFEKKRSRDINVECGISDNPGVMKYFLFKESALNTFDERLATEYEKMGHEIKECVEVEACRINELLEQYLPQNQNVDFIDIDVEGYDEKIVEDIDWNVFRPTVVMVENFQTESAMDKAKPHKKLLESGYELVAKTGLTCFYYRR